MASNPICRSCLRAIRQQARTNIRQPAFQSLPKNRVSIQRSFATSPSLLKNKETPLSDLSTDPFPAQPPPPPPAPAAFENLASTLRNASRSTTEPYIAYGSTEDLFRECARQCTYTVPSALSNPPTAAPQNAAGDHLGEGQGWWLEPKSKGGLGLEVTFNSWAQVIFLHMWMLTVRLRCFPEQYVKDWHQNLLDHFFYAAEDRMATWHGMSARGVRNKNLKDLWLQWRGVQLGYDEGLVRGDAVLATAVWRNLWKASPGVDVADLAVVTAYVMRELQRLGDMDDMKITSGQISFGEPKGLERLVAKESPAMRQTLPAVESQAENIVAKGT